MSASSWGGARMSLQPFVWQPALMIGFGVFRCQIRYQTPEGGQSAEAGLMARGRADSPPASGGGGVGGTTHDIFPTPEKLFGSPGASDRDGVLVGQGGVEDRTAAVVDRSSAAVFGRSAAEATLLLPCARSSEKGPVSQPTVRSLKPAMDDAHRRGFPARKPRTRPCQACESINDASARICQAAPHTALQHPALGGHVRCACPSVPVPPAEHRRYLASHKVRFASHKVRRESFPMAHHPGGNPGANGWFL